MILIEFILTGIGIYLSFYVFYWFILLFAHFLIKEPNRRNIKVKIRFAIIVPAHNEEMLLSRLLKSIESQHYPPGLFKAVVVADNCVDNTAGVALKHKALVLERTDPANLGKGYAIKWALENIDLKGYDAVFVVDADSVMDGDALAELDQVLRRGNGVIQCYNGVANPDDSWFTRLLDVSRTISNEIYHPSKQKLGLSSYLMGNGMCFSSEVLLRYGWRAFTVGEDWEYYAKLIQDGEKVAFARNARVYHRESSSLKQATTQRMRWSSGRFAVVSNYGIGLFLSGLKERNMVKLDASLPLILPNPSLGMNISAVMLFFSAVFPWMAHRALFVNWFLVLILLQLGIFMTGIMYTKNKAQKFLSIFVAPLFLAWKMGIDILSACGMGRDKWVRTERKL